MKTLFALATLTLTASAGPVLLTGSGSWSWGWGGDSGFSVSAVGDGVLISYQGSPSPIILDPAPLFGGTTHCGIGCNGFGFAQIGQQYSTNFTFGLGRDFSWLNLYDGAGNEIASADLVGWITITSEEAHWFDDNGHQILDWSQGTFAVGTPEPGTAWLALLGAIALLVIRLRSRPC